MTITPSGWAAATAIVEIQAGPRVEQNAAREGRLASGPAGPYRARWIWCGPEQTLRNKAARPEWADDLTGRDGYSYPLPAVVPMTFAEGMQPVHAGGVVYALDQEGKAYAIDLKDGTTRWVGENPGGSVASPVVVGRLLGSGWRVHCPDTSGDPGPRCPMPDPTPGTPDPAEGTGTFALPPPTGVSA